MEIRTISNTTKEDKDVKIVRNSRLARRILNLGGDDVRIVDIKPDRDNKERSVFAFRNDAKFQRVFAEVLSENEAYHHGYEHTRSQEKIEELTKQVEELKKMLAEKE